MLEQQGDRATAVGVGVVDTRHRGAHRGHAVCIGDVATEIDDAHGGGVASARRDGKAWRHGVAAARIGGTLSAMHSICTSSLFVVSSFAMPLMALLDASPATACSREAPAPTADFTVFPADGASNVARDARVVVVFSDLQEALAESSLALQQGDDGAPVDVVVDVEPFLLEAEYGAPFVFEVLTPQAPLSPSTPTRVLDTRTEPPTVLATFTTGDASLTEDVPLAPVVTVGERTPEVFDRDGASCSFQGTAVLEIARAEPETAGAFTPQPRLAIVSDVTRDPFGADATIRALAADGDATVYRPVGTHTLQVRFLDVAGRLSPPTEVTFTIDEEASACGGCSSTAVPGQALVWGSALAALGVVARRRRAAATSLTAKKKTVKAAQKKA